MSEKERNHTAPLAEPLTPREQEVLTLLGERRTNQQIADELVIAYSTVRWYLRQISNKLGVSGREAVVERAQALGLISGQTAPPRRRTNLPTAATRFLGREAELQALGELLLDPHVRLLTIVGPGGIGKTRLALRLADRQVRRRIPGSDRHLFPGGVWYVSAAPLDTAAELVPAVAAALDLNVQPLEAGARDLKQDLLDFLRRKRMLLLLDNLEHLPRAALLVGELLASAPQLKLLLASRRRLQMQGERVFALGGLELPAEDGRGSLARNPAVRLFSETAQRVQPELAFDDDALAAVARICCLVEGTPLAIELAASWASILPPEKIEREVQRGLDILAAELADVPPRHRSMQAALDVSWARLGEEEQEVFRRLSVFRGGFTRRAAREVAGATLQSLKKLIDASWLTHDQQDDRCYVQELLRQYGESRLQGEAETERAAREAHARYFAGRLAALEPDWFGPRMREALDAVQVELDNARQAWRWAVRHGHVDYLAQGLESLRVYYDNRGDEGEARGLLRAAAESMLRSADETGDDIARRRLLARLLVARAGFGGAIAERRVILEQAESLLNSLRWEGVEVTQEEAFWAWQKGLVELYREPAAALPYFQRARALYTQLDHKPGMALAQSARAGTNCHLGNGAAARVLAKQALAEHRALGNQQGIAGSVQTIGSVVREAGRLDEAVEAHREAYCLRRKLRDTTGTIVTAYYLAETLLWSGQLREARQVAAEGFAEAERMGSPRLLARAGYARAVTLLHLGQYEEARRYAELGVMKAREIGGAQSIGYGLVCAGQCSLALREPDDALAQLAEAAEVLGAYQDVRRTLPLLYAAYVWNGRDALSASRAAVAQALRQNRQRRSFLATVTAIPVAAQILAQTEDRQRALELYALACRYSYVSNSRWFADMIADDISVLVSALGQEQAVAAQERGQARDLWATAEALAVEMGEHSPAAA